MEDRRSGAINNRRNTRDPWRGTWGSYKRTLSVRSSVLRRDGDGGGDVPGGDRRTAAARDDVQALPDTRAGAGGAREPAAVQRQVRGSQTAGQPGHQRQGRAG